MERIAVFYDVLTLNLNLKRKVKPNITVDQKKILKRFKEVGEVKLSFAYVTLPTAISSDKLRNIEQSVRSLGYEVRAHICKAEGRTLSWNVGITVDAMDNKDAYDTAIIVSGDNGLLELVKYLTRNGKKVLIACPLGTIGSELANKANGIIELDGAYCKEREDEGSD